MNVSIFATRLRYDLVTIAAIFACNGFISYSIAPAEDRLTQPVYRVPNGTSASQTTAAVPETTTATPAATASTTTAATTTPTTATAAPVAAALPSAAAAAPPAGAPFDLKQQPGEHVLAPVIRTLKASQASIDQNVRDYSCTLVKRERVDGELGEYQHILMRVAHDPFSVYMSFIKPHTGREVLYVAGQNENKLIVLEAGFKRLVGKLHLDPQGATAMNGQKRPITDVGFRNLTAKLIRLWEAESKFEECEVTSNADTRIDGRSTTMFQVTHPLPRQNFNAHVARIFFDNELRVPIHYDAYSWPPQEGAQPSLEESYTYRNLKFNNGFTARDFDAYNNPDIFK